MLPDFCNFAPVVEGKEGILQKKKSHFVRDQNVLLLYPARLSIRRRVREFLYIIFVSACTNQHEAQAIVVAGETSFDCYCIPLLQVCFQVLRNVPLKCSHCSLATHLLGKLDTIECALQNVRP